MRRPDLFRIPKKSWNAGRIIGPKLCGTRACRLARAFRSVGAASSGEPPNREVHELVERCTALHGYLRVRVAELLGDVGRVHPAYERQCREGVVRLVHVAVSETELAERLGKGLR